MQPSTFQESSAPYPSSVPTYAYGKEGNHGGNYEGGNYDGGNYGKAGGQLQVGQMDLEGLTTVSGVKVSDAQTSVRLGFIRKVYGILTVQLLATAIVGTIFMVVEPVRGFALSSPTVFTVSLFVPFVVLIALLCNKNSYPLNMYLLAAFTLAESYTIGVVCATYYESGQGTIVLEAVLLTGAVFCSLTTYCFITKKDFSFLGAGLFAGLMVLILWGFFQMLFPSFFGEAGHTIYSVLGALLFSLYILYDTSLIMHHLSPDDYIVGAINLYLDIINLFLHLLSLLSDR